MLLYSSWHSGWVLKGGRSFWRAEVVEGGGRHNMERKPCRQRYLSENKYPRSIWERVSGLVLLRLGFKVGGSWQIKLEKHIMIMT